MIITDTKIPGCFVIDPEPNHDERGFFARSFCAQEFRSRGLSAQLQQCGISFNHRQWTLRGMHYQQPPHAECKLVRCTRGAVFDVAVDLRPDSPAYLQWHAVELTAHNRRMHYLTQGLAHGFLTLEDDTELFYQMSSVHHPQSARGVRWDDPALAIRWPHAPAVIAERDAAYPLIEPLALSEHPHS